LELIRFHIRHPLSHVTDVEELELLRALTVMGKGGHVVWLVKEKDGDLAQSRGNDVLFAVLRPMVMEDRTVVDVERKAELLVRFAILMAN